TLGGALGAGGAALSEGLGILSGLASKSAKGPKVASAAGVGKTPPVDRRSSRWLNLPQALRDVPGMKTVATVVEKGGPTAVILSAVQEGGLSAVASTVGTAVPLAVGAAVAGKTIRAMFSDPIRGGLLSAHGSQVLGSLPLFDGDEQKPVPPPMDIRH